MQLNLHLLKIFYTVTEKQSFSLAAKSLFISQPAVSKAVKELEHQLGFALIERGQSRNKLKLTQFGERIYEHAKGIFALEKIAVEEIESLTGVVRGSLIIGASTTIAGYRLGHLIQQFCQNHPDIEIKIKVGNTQQVKNWLIECEIDLAFVEGQVRDPRLELIQWQADELVIIGNNSLDLLDDNLTEQLSEMTWIMRESGSGTRDWADQILARQAIKPKKTIEVASNEGILQMVRLGLGMALVPKVVAADLLSLQAIQQIHFEGQMRFSRDLYQLVHRDRANSPAAAKFLANLE